MKNYIFGVHSKIRLLGGSGSVKTRGAVCRFKWGGGGVGKKEGVVFLKRGFDTSMHTVIDLPHYD